MEIYQIRAFVTVARLGNLTKAADALSLTQPAVTAQIKALEQSLGVALFERAAGRLTLAKAGEALLPTAESLLVLGARLKAEAQQLQGSLHGTVELGIPSELPDFLRLGELASAMRDQLPLIELKTVILSSVQLHEQVQTGRMQAALTVVVNPPRGTYWLPLRSVRYRIAMPAELAGALKRGGWREVAQLPWLDGSAGSHTHLLLREETALAGAESGEFIVWGQARADATLGFMMSNERASEPVLVALTSLMQKIWQPGATRRS